MEIYLLQLPNMRNFNLQSTKKKKEKKQRILLEQGKFKRLLLMWGWYNMCFIYRIYWQKQQYSQSDRNPEDRTLQRPCLFSQILYPMWFRQENNESKSLHSQQNTNTAHPLVSIKAQNEHKTKQKNLPLQQHQLTYCTLIYICTNYTTSRTTTEYTHTQINC